MTSIGIDFGTTNSLVAEWSGGQARALRIDTPRDLTWVQWGFADVLPSVVALDPDIAEGTPIFGWEAKVRPGSQKAIKRLLVTDDTLTLGKAQKQFLVEEIASMIFGRLRSQALANEAVDFDTAVVTVPANSRGLARYRTKLCAGMAGIQVPMLINEPTAAAMAYGVRASEDQTLLVVDWGGGTLDITLLEIVGGIFMERASKGIVRGAGGLDFDRCIADHLRPRIPGSDTWNAVTEHDFMLEIEKLKVELSSKEDATLKVDGAERLRVTRRELSGWIADLVMQVEGPIRTVLQDARMSPASIDHLLLVGGTCRMPVVRDAVCAIAGREPTSGVDPMTAIAQGAAIAAAILNGEHDGDFYVGIEHDLGTNVLRGSSLVFDRIIGRNTKLPARASSLYSPVGDMQAAIDFGVIEGDAAKPLDHEDNVVLKNWVVPIPPRPLGVSSFEVTYEYDVEGILHVTIVDLTTDEVLFQEDVGGMLGRDKRTLVQAAGRVAALVAEASRRDKASAALTPRAAELIEVARSKIIPFLDGEAQQRLLLLVADVERAAADGTDPGAVVDQLDAEVKRYPYLL